MLEGSEALARGRQVAHTLPLVVNKYHEMRNEKETALTEELVFSVPLANMPVVMNAVRSGTLGSVESFNMELKFWTNRISMMALSFSLFSVEKWFIWNLEKALENPPS